ncbi:MAG: putative epimerase, PhzC/PhzF [Solirubrobacteraceae bacterium]|nr:putative epimerase, PhzC/PhzF [Solirubrobacteraceae bacterium]
MVHDADGIGDDTMLAYARETSLSETTFVQSGDADADYRNRIWMTTGELPFAGHPSLGTAVAVAHVRGDRSAHYVQRTLAGLQPCDVELDGLVARASMLQEPPQYGEELDPAHVFAALGLDADAGHPDLPPQIVDTGVPQLLAPLAGAETLARARPDAPALAALLAETSTIVVYAAVCDTEAGTADTRGFFVGPGDIGQEDPATGSAAGPLMAYLHQRAGLAALTIDQGVQMGRPSRLDAAFEGDRPRVGGEVVILSQGTLHL